MQERIEARAGLNGSGAGHEVVAVIDVDETPVPLAAEPPRRRCPALDPIRADPARYAEVKRLVTETTLSLKTISVRSGITYTTLRNLIKEEAWPRPADAPKGPALADGAPLSGRRRAVDISDVELVRARLVRAVDRQIGKVEVQLSKKASEIEEKHSRILGNLAKTLATLMDMGKGAPTRESAEAPSRGEDVERRLADRIKRWARGEEGY